MEKIKKLARQQAVDGKFGALDLSFNDIYELNNRKSKNGTFNMSSKACTSMELHQVEQKEFKSSIVLSGNHKISKINEASGDEHDSAVDVGIGRQNNTAPEKGGQKTAEIKIQ